MVCDTDWDSLVVNTSDKVRFEHVRAICCATFLHAHLPPKLPRFLHEAGFRLQEARTVPMMTAGHAHNDGSSFTENWAFRIVPEKAREAGLPEVELRGWLQEQETLGRQDAFFVCVHRFLFLGLKPSRV